MSTSEFEATFAEERQRYARHVSSPYVDFLARVGLDLDIVQAEGVFVVDRQGRPYLDCIAGYGNLNLGHNHPRVIEAMVTHFQSRRPFNWPFLSALYSRLAETLATVVPAGLDCSLVVNSGAEAVDSALKLVRLATGKPHVITMRGAWHGFTLGAMSVSEPSMCRDFLPLLPQVTAVPYGDSGAVESSLTDRTGAVLVEPIQAESGALAPPPGYLQRLRELCTRHRILLIIDEIKTGVGKTGAFLACEHESVVPDLLLLGKSLGGGVVSMGALLGRREYWGKVGWSFPMAASSGAGNAAACAAALATLDVIQSERLVARASELGDRLRNALRELHERIPKSSVSGTGLLVGLHLPDPGTALRVVRCCAQRGVLVMTAFCKRSCILIEPPLIITERQLDQVSDTVIAAVLEESRHPTDARENRS